MADQGLVDEDSCADVRARCILSATRLHLRADADEVPEVTRDHLRSYVQQARRLGVTVAIAVNSHEATVRGIVEEETPDLNVHVLSVPCWGAFVPALNTLLGFAQAKSFRYILFQSLEVRCGPAVLTRLLDFFTRDTLVVGPEMPGHAFSLGEAALNGRTVPWNTLALWSVRKLALTGFLSIADGMPAGVFHGDRRPDQGYDETNVVGGSDSSRWWEFEDQPHFVRQVSGRPETVPAGVEEVTAIALHQHLRSQEEARAILVRLPKKLEAETSWSASWAGDEGRAQWHAYKMASKVSRPAAQLQRLFPSRTKSKSSTNMFASGLQNCSSDREILKTEKVAGASQSSCAPVPVLGSTTSHLEEAIDAEVHFGMVLHYSDSIPPFPRMWWPCLAAVLLLGMNSTLFLAHAFRDINSTPTASSAGMLAHVVVLIGGDNLPMPFSLWLTRSVVGQWSHRHGMALVGVFLLFSHLMIIASQFSSDEGVQTSVMLLARFIQGLGSGVRFLARFVLASVSTTDHHVDLQKWLFLADDLGRGIGALLPFILSRAPGCELLTSNKPDFLPSLAVFTFSIAYLLAVYLVFPSRLPVLADSIRFDNATESVSNDRSKPQETDVSSYRFMLWISGTARVSVQSAIIPVIALCLRDAGWTGHFRQTIAVAGMCLLPMPFEAIVTKIRCSCFSGRGGHPRDTTQNSKAISGIVGVLSLILASFLPATVNGSGAVEEAADIKPLLSRIAELSTLCVALGMAAPFNASRLYQLPDAEYATAMLELMKAYIGRILGPLAAFIAYSVYGYNVIFGLMCLLTLVVPLTA
eukprot:TRINITY_DN3582_c0_g1_i5.p1 TRINITY_DN3582_c0_g1~~TRINITY_DN3582_c0_g1_i5.p1  ORF type:complete len:842 (+),score=109.48 TRINITY_DN3582_c0_g1_i5:98-2527(+)